jgi:hypothetical protein
MLVEVGNISNISKNTSRIVVDTIDPIFDQQPTTIDAYVNAPISIIVYDSQVTNLNGGTVDEGITYQSQMLVELVWLCQPLLLSNLHL